MLEIFDKEENVWVRSYSVGHLWGQPYPNIKQKILQKEVQIVEELEEYLALLQKEIKTVQNFLEKNYENEDTSISNIKGKKVGSVRCKLLFVVPKVI